MQVSGQSFRARLGLVSFLFCVAAFGGLAFGLSFYSEGVKYSIPKKVVIKVGAETLFSSSKPKSWDEETDKVFRFRFDTHDFLIVGTWDSEGSTSYRLFHLSSAAKDIKQYQFMSAVEDDNRGEFFTFEGKLHYWESKHCGKKIAMVFNPGALEFEQIQLKDVPKGGCLPADMQTSKRKNKIEWKKLSNDE